MKCSNCGFSFWPKPNDGYPSDRTECRNCIDKATERKNFNDLACQTITYVEEEDGLWTIHLCSGTLITAVDGEFGDNAFVITKGE